MVEVGWMVVVVIVAARLYIYVTECSVCVSGYYPLTFLSCPFSFLIGWEFYGPNYLKC